MKKIRLFELLPVVLFCCFALMGCKSQTIYVPVQSTKTVTQLVRDTLVQVKLEKEYLARTVKDTTSRLENTYATSTATWHNGFLYHDLASKPVKVETKLKYITTSTTDTIHVPYPITTFKDVRLPMRWYQKAFYYLGICCFVGGSLVLGAKLRI